MLPRYSDEDSEDKDLTLTVEMNGGGALPDFISLSGRKITFSPSDYQDGAYSLHVVLSDSELSSIYPLSLTVIALEVDDDNNTAQN